MKLRRLVLPVMLMLAVLLALAWFNRLHLLRYSLGWYTDIRFPREPNRPVPWQDGPASASQPASQRPPNVIIILADDLGINDVSTFGGGHSKLGVPTPAIDSIARDGVRFDNGYAGAAVCTVSRAALLTGRYPWRFGVEFTPTPGAMARVAGELYADPNRSRKVIINQDAAKAARDFNDLGMPESEQTLAEVLKARGYHNVHIGKWHLGSTTSMRPNNQGFHETLFMESGLFLPEKHPQVVNSKQDFDPIDKFLWPNMRWGVSYNGGKWFEPARYLTDYYTDEAVDVIRRNRNRPFFLYLAHWGVHTPLQADKADYDALSGIADHRLRVYASMVRSIDRSVARVLAALKAEGLEENTIVVFTSDNGAPGYVGLPDLNKPYRGWKLTLFEGGVRVPYVAKWPAGISAGLQYKAPVSNIDLMPTIAAAAGASLPADRPIDGVNLLPYLKAGRDQGVAVAQAAESKPSTQSAPSPLASHPAVAAQPTSPPQLSPPQLSQPQLSQPQLSQPQRPLFWRDGDYRSVQHSGWKLIAAHRPKKSWLFNLNVDPTERNNLASSEPQQLARLQALLDAHHAGMPAPRWPSFIEFPVAIDKTLNQPEASDDEYTYWVN